MPKMSIYQGASAPGSLQEHRVEVSWSRGYDVKIATTKLTNDDADPTDESIEPSAEEPATDTATRAWDGWSIDLDRAQINHLIRVLKKARDQAYGRDE